MAKLLATQFIQLIISVGGGNKSSALSLNWLINAGPANFIDLIAWKPAGLIFDSKNNPSGGFFTIIYTAIQNKSAFLTVVEATLKSNCSLIL